MGGFFGITSKTDCIWSVFFGVDYHSHLGTMHGGMAAYDPNRGFQRCIHNIENTPFRTKFEKDADGMSGTSCIGCISDTDPQPIIIRDARGLYAMCITGLISNAEELTEMLLKESKSHFEARGSGRVNGAELVAALISEKDNMLDGLLYAQDLVKGSLAILILTDKQEIIVARDKLGRMPTHIGKNDEGYCVSFESFACEKLGFELEHELKPGEITMITSNGYKTLFNGHDKMRICSFLWTYYGYPSSTYERINVEVSRNKNGTIMAEEEQKNGARPDVDYICGVPDSGVPHALGYAHTSGIPFARPFIKYTPTWPRSFMSSLQSVRNHVAKMKILPIHELIYGKRLLFVDDSIVRGTQLRETVDFLYNNGAKEVHMRSACPPVMYSCKYLNFSRSTSEMELIARRTIFELEGENGFNHIEEYSDGSTERGKALRAHICQSLNLSSLEFQSIDGLKRSIGLDPCSLCTYCWTGKE